MLRHSALLSALLLLASLVAPGLRAETALPPGVTLGPSIEGVTEYRLANGLRILLIPDASIDTLTRRPGRARSNPARTAM